MPSQPSPSSTPSAFSQWWVTTGRKWALLYAFGAYFATYEKLKFAEILRGFRVDWLSLWAQWHMKLIANKGSAPNQYRVLSFVFADGFASLGIPPFYAHMFLRLVFLWLASMLLHYAWKRWLPDQGAGLMVGFFLLANSIAAMPLIQPSEPLNLVFFALFALWLPQARWGWIVALAFVGAWNKLTVVFFAPVVFFCLLLAPQDPQETPTKRWLRAFVWASATGLAALCTRGMVMWLWGKKAYYTSFWMLPNNLAWMSTTASGWNFVWLTVLPMLAVFLTWRRQPTAIKAFALMVPFFIAGHLMITLVSEVRTFLATLVLLLPGLWLALFGPKEPTAPDEA